MALSDGWNIARQLAAFPCAKPDPVIIAVTLVPAILPALVEWYSFGCRDLLKFRLGRSVPCGRMLQGRAIQAIPPVFQDLFKNILKFEAKFSFVGQLFLLADLISETSVRWHTLAYQLSGCPDALDGAAWQIEFSAPQTLAPDTPTIIGGAIRNLTGRLDIATPTGALVPIGWYFQIQFTIKARAIASNDSVALTVWIEKRNGFAYSYDGNAYPPADPGGEASGSYLLTSHNGNSRRREQYVMMAQSSVYALTTEVSATAQCTPIIPSSWTLSPLSCVRNWDATRVEDPGRTNRRGRLPTIGSGISALTGADTGHGDPGGLPRPKK